MFKVLIVEDEMFVRLGIKASIEWEKLDMKVIADAENGQAAWEVYQKQKPHLILTDIKMPMMDGIELIEKIRDNDSKTKIIILSCLEDFELARKAMSLGVSDYILKLTMSQEEMETVLKKVRDEMKESTSLPPSSVDGDANTDISKETVVYNYLFYGICTEKKFAEQVAEFNIRLNSQHLVLCIMEIDRYREFQSKFGDEQGRLIRFSFLNVVNEILEGYQRGLFFHERDKRYVLIFSFFDLDKSREIWAVLNEILEHIKRVMKSYLDCSVSFGISSMQDGYDSLRKLYDKSAKAIEYKYFTGAGETILMPEISVKKIEEEVNIRLERMIESFNGFNDGHFDSLKAKLDAFMETFNMSKVEMQMFFLRLGHWVLVSVRLNHEDMWASLSEYTRNIEFCETLDESVNVLTDYVETVSEIKSEGKIYSPEVVKAKEFIQEHYNKQISLQCVADRVGLSANYLSGLFKKETGMGIMAYVMRYRVEKAKPLLSNTNMKVYEIGMEVGYTDESYFSRSFKKITGVRPNDFRKKWVHPREFDRGK